jgi:hypothetical protein
VNFSRTPEPMPPNLRKSAATESKGSPCSITSVDKPRCMRISSESFSLVYSALRDAMLTHPTLVEGFIPLFSSVPSVPKSAAEAKGL